MSEKETYALPESTQSKAGWSFLPRRFAVTFISLFEAERTSDVELKVPSMDPMSAIISASSETRDYESADFRVLGG